MALAGSAPPLTATDAFVATCFKPATTRATGTSLRTDALAGLPRDTSLEGRQMTIPRRFAEAEENRTNVRRARIRMRGFLAVKKVIGQAPARGGARHSGRRCPVDQAIVIA